MYYSFTVLNVTLLIIVCTLAEKYVDLIGHMIIQTKLPAEARYMFIRGVVDLLQSSNNQLATHPNANIYK